MQFCAYRLGGRGVVTQKFNSYPTQLTVDTPGKYERPSVAFIKLRLLVINQLSCNYVSYKSHRTSDPLDICIIAFSVLFMKVLFHINNYFGTVSGSYSFVNVHISITQ